MKWWLFVCCGIPRRTKAAGRTFSQGHLPVTYSMILVGSGFSLLLEEYSHELHSKPVWLLGGALFAAMTMVMLLRLTHRGWRSELGILRSTDDRIIVSATGRCEMYKGGVGCPSQGSGGGGNGGPPQTVIVAAQNQTAPAPQAHEDDGSKGLHHANTEPDLVHRGPHLDGAVRGRWMRVRALVPGQRFVFLHVCGIVSQ